MHKYYLDSCIWRDYFENRSDNLRPLGDWAFALLKKIIKENDIVIFSDSNEEEISAAYSGKEINEMLSIIPSEMIINVWASQAQLKEAIALSKKLKIPVKDALHAVIARDNGAILVTRDKHFYELQDRITIKKPEELI